QQRLGAAAYAGLARPSENNPVAYYSQVQPDLFADIVAGRLQDPAGRMVARAEPQRQQQRRHAAGPTADMSGMSGMAMRRN
ncbi:MAG: COX aromatic rich motif-containing protein, partial [Gammaproteobacteria bacterium]|nr:COX aromatic rich motif-containing protein [Gammaproteobacteria bacterium]